MLHLYLSACIGHLLYVRVRTECGVQKGDPDAASPQAAGRYSQWSMGSIPNQGTRIPHAAQHGEKGKKKKINRFVEGREKGKKGGRGEGWTLSPEGWWE